MSSSFLLSLPLVQDLVLGLYLDTCGICQHRRPASSIQGQPVVRILCIVGDILVPVDVGILLADIGTDILVCALQQSSLSRNL